MGSFRAQDVIDACRKVATFTEEPGRTTRTFLCEPMRDVHRFVGDLMSAAGLDVCVDHAGNIIGRSGERSGPRVMVGSHLDTVPNAGAFDGILGVIMGIALAHEHPIDVIGFSEEEGVRFGVPFIGSRSYVGTLDDEILDVRDKDGCTVRQAMDAFGLTPATTAELPDYFLEIHIEQGPVLECLGQPLGIVTAIAGQSRLQLTFTGEANHAGTTPMSLRADALAAAAEWISVVERTARERDGFVATVGRLSVAPNATNVVPGEVIASLDVRHANNALREAAVTELIAHAHRIAEQRRIDVATQTMLTQPAVPMSPEVINALATADPSAHRMVSGAGHDAMILAPVVPTGMLFVRSPGGISHNPAETVLLRDVEAALRVASAAIRTLRSIHV